MARMPPIEAPMAAPSTATSEHGDRGSRRAAYFSFGGYRKLLAIHSALEPDVL